VFRQTDNGGNGGRLSSVDCSLSSSVCDVMYCGYVLCRNVVNDSADVTSSRRSFHVSGPAIGKARLLTVDSLLVGTTRRLVPTERSDRRLVRSATRVKGPEYPGASPWMTLNVNTTILNSILSGTRRQWRQRGRLSSVVVCL